MTIQMTAVELYFQVVHVHYAAQSGSPFKPVDETLVYDHSNESSIFLWLF